MKNKTNPERETPITDGDSRPDQNLDGLKRSKREARNRADEKEFTKERGADTNTLEDFKDAKSS